MSDRLIPPDIDAQLRAGDILRWTLSKPSGAPPEDAAERPPRITGRLIETDGDTVCQIALRRGTQEFHENLTLADAADRLDAWLQTDYRHLHLFGTEADYELRRKSAGKLKIRRAPPSQTDHATTHDRRKQTLLPDDRPVPFLIAAGLMTEAGRIKAAARAKFRQIDRYLQFLDELRPEFPTDRPLRAIDFGCGKSYLTFALQYWYREVLGRDLELTGLDRNPQVIAHCQNVVADLNLSGIAFERTAIADYRPTGPVDLVVSLHACDTATDDALLQAVRWNARVIMAVPCCQHELLGQLEADALRPLLRHGILRERFAAQATDSLRALALEARGYRTDVVEFIDMEHTPKNVLIRAVRDDCAPRTAKAREEYAAFKQFLGVQHVQCDALLDDA